MLDVICGRCLRSSGHQKGEKETGIVISRVNQTIHAWVVTVHIIR